MRTLIFFCVLFVVVVAGATTYTEFFVDSNSGYGTNVNSGSTSNAAATYTSLNGNWDGTSIYTPVDGSTPASTVTTNTFASVYLDGATNAVYLARIESVAAGVNGAITLSTTAVGGTAPTSGATGRSIKVGGAWSGPRNASTVPFALVTYTLTNAAGNSVRVNWRSGGTNTLSAGITHANIGPVRWEGYLVTPGDDAGKAILDMNSVNASILTISAANHELHNFIFQNNSLSGTGSGLALTGGEALIRGCVAKNLGGRGFVSSTVPSVFVECEAYKCNCGNTADYGGFFCNVNASIYNRCYSHDHTNTAANGFTLSSGTSIAVYDHCIAAYCASNGFSLNSQAITYLLNCNSYSNKMSGLDLASASSCLAYIENCAFFRNARYGIESSGSLVLRNGQCRSNVFGSGTMTNLLGNVSANLQGLNVDTPIIYAANTTPWTAPDTGNFTPTANTAIINAGRGTFTATASGFSPTLSYPDIGSGQITNAATAANSSQFSFPIAQ